MPVMSHIEQAFCRSSPWRRFSRRTVLPWVTRGHVLYGEVLEIGSGSGAIGADLLDRFPITTLVSTDLDPRMVDAAGRRLERHGARAQATRADATDLPFDAGRFHAVVSCLMLHHVIEWERAIGEAFRVLRAGGLFLGYDLTATPAARLLHRLDRSPFRLAAEHEIARALRAIDARDVDLSDAWAGHVVRFVARKHDFPPVGGAGARGTQRHGARRLQLGARDEGPLASTTTRLIIEVGERSQPRPTDEEHP